MKRADRSEKIKERKLYRETVIKSTLRKYVYGEPEDKDRIIEAIQNRVLSFSKAINFASIALCGLIKDLFDGKEVKDVKIPDIFEPTFIRQLMLGTQDAVKPVTDVNEYHKQYPFLLPDIKRYLGDRNIFSHGATQFVTNFKNSLESNFYSRIKQYLNQCQDIYKFSQDERVMAYYKIMGWKMHFKLEEKTIRNTKLLELVKEQRAILNLEDGVEVGKKWLKNIETQKNILRQWVHFNRFYQSHKLKQFLISPIASIRSKFITIDTDVLYGLAQELNLIEHLKNASSEKVGEKKKSLRDTFYDNIDHYWSSIFKISKLLKKSTKEFTNTINTDGVSLCTHFRKLKETGETGQDIGEVIFDEDKDRILSCDPGRVNIFTIVEKIFGTEEWKSYVLTRKKFYNDAGVFEARENAEKWHKGIKRKLEALSLVSVKGACVKDHQDYLKTFIEVQEDLWFEYTKNRWARQRLELYGGKKRVFAKFFNMIKNAGDFNKEIKMFFGAAKFAPGAPNELSVPTSRAFRECVERFVVKLVNEFRTSKVHYETDIVLQGISNQTYKRVNQHNTIRSKRPQISKKGNDTLRGLLWYSSTIQEKSKFIDRDINAAKNIYRCGMLSVRPQILCQTKNTKKLEFVTGKKIRTLLYL